MKKAHTQNKKARRGIPQLKTRRMGYRSTLERKQAFLIANEEKSDKRYTKPKKARTRRKTP